MATPRDKPYSQFNFLVDLGSGTDSVQAGFQDVSGLGMEITVAEYRSGNKKDNAVDKITTRYKVPDVTLKRGVIGSVDLYEWLNQVRDGSQTALRSVTITLLSEDRAAEAVKWRLKNARPIKYTGPALSGKGTELAIEELVLACEGIDIE